MLDLRLQKLPYPSCSMY